MDLKWWVHFGDDVELPNICDKNCLGCHVYGGGYNGGLFLTSFDNLMIGGNSGPAVIPYYGEASLIIQKLNGTAAGSQMPLYAENLDQSTINLIKTWIDEGAIYNDGGGLDSCLDDEILDCDNNCVDIGLLENGICDDGIVTEANLNCTSLFFDGDCINNFENCSPDCPVGIINFGNIDIDFDNETSVISGQLEILMDCQFNVSEFSLADFNLEAIIIGALGKIYIDNNSHVGDVHHLVSKYSYIAQMNILKSGILKFIGER